MPFGERKQNPYTKRNLIQARVDAEEFRLILIQAQIHTDGDLSKFVRMAALNYKPKAKK